MVDRDNPLHKEEIDQLWIKEVEKRFSDIKSGKVKLISSEELFKNIRKRLKKT